MKYFPPKTSYYRHVLQELQIGLGKGGRLGLELAGNQIKVVKQYPSRLCGVGRAIKNK